MWKIDDSPDEKRRQAFRKEFSTKVIFKVIFHHSNQSVNKEAISVTTLADFNLVENLPIVYGLIKSNNRIEKVA